MPDFLSIVVNQGTAEIVEKKSRFIAAVVPVHSEAEALSFIEAKKKQYYNASHNCSAYTLGQNHELTHCSDDGETSSTAGRPMLEVLLKEDIHDVCVVVTRYFGGTLLGTGGLVRAYQSAVKEGLSAALVVKKQLGFPVRIQTDYNGVGKLQYLAKNLNLPITETLYTEAVGMTVLTTKDTKTSFINKATEATCGKAVFTELDPVWFYENENDICFLNE